MFRTFLIALQFMTVFRLRDNLNETPEDLAEAVGWFPLVGLVLGLLLAVVYLVLSPFLPPTVLGLLLVLAQAFFTNGLHLDGLADTADGLYSHRDRERKLAIMKDSAIGVFGAAALIFIIGLQASLLSEISGLTAWPVVALFPVWGRWAASLTAALSVYAREDGGLGRPFINLAGKKEIVRSAVVALAVSFLLLGIKGLVAALIVSLLAVAAVRLWSAKLGGVTGDILGAVIMLGETLGLLLAVALA